MSDRLAAKFNSFNTAHPWSHNDLYAPLLIHHARAVRRRGGMRALDVGCGTGNLIGRIARHIEHVVGVEQDDAAAERAAAGTDHLPGVRVVHGSFPDDVPGEFDLVTMVAVLHHLSLADGIVAARRAVAPGGRLVIVGAFRETSSDLGLSLASVLLNPLIGAIKHPKPCLMPPINMTAPVVEPSESFDEIRRELQRELPGVRVRRAFFWRYVAVWAAPRSNATSRSTLGEWQIR